MGVTKPTALRVQGIVWVPESRNYFTVSRICFKETTQLGRGLQGPGRTAAPAPRGVPTWKAAVAVTLSAGPVFWAGLETVKALGAQGLLAPDTFA